MSMTDKRNMAAQRAFDTRPVLTRFHLWLEDVEIERAQEDADRAFAPRGITRCLAMTAAATALGTRLFGHFGEGVGKDKYLVDARLAPIARAHGLAVLLTTRSFVGR